jgi:parallel beta-helix repeat protein
MQKITYKTVIEDFSVNFKPLSVNYFRRGRKGLIRRFVSGLMLTLLITSILALMYNVQPVKGEWTGTVYILADGSIDPPDAPITTSDNITYLLTDNITSFGDGIIIERDDIIIDGAGYKLQGSQSGVGFSLCGRNNVTIKNTHIQNFQVGISISFSSNIGIVENNVTNNVDGIHIEESAHNNILSNIMKENVDVAIYLGASSNNTISRNKITQGVLNGIQLENYSNYNNIFENDISENGDSGIQMMGSSNNGIFRNNITLNHNVGIEMAYSSNNSIFSNNLQNSEMGILLYYSYMNVLKRNFFENHFGEDAYAIWLENSDNNAVMENKLNDADHFIGLYASFLNVIRQNNATDVFDGIVLIESSDNVFSRNLMQSNFAMGCGIDIGYESVGNIFYQNTIVGFSLGISVGLSNDSVFCWNNFIGNEVQAEIEDSTVIWDNGYPSGGNYWSDYNGGDLYRGSYQNETGSDGVGDSSYIIDENNIDRYPLMGPFGGSTLEGRNVTAYPSLGVCLIFENVNTEGVTSVNVTGIGPEPPNGFQLAGNYYDIKTTANYAGTIKLRIVYDDSNMTLEEERSLRLMQWDETLQQWVDITTSIDVEYNQIFGETTHLSIFVIFTTTLAPPTLCVSINPLSASIIVGQSVSFTSTVSGGYTPYSYQWYLNDSVVSGAASNTWTFTPLTIGTYKVYLNVTDSSGNVAISDTATITVSPQLTISISPTSASILVGQPVTFTSTTSGGYPPYAYQWFLDGNPVLGATSNNWTFTPTESRIYYIKLKVTDAQGNTAQSDVARVLAASVPVGGYSIPMQAPTKVELILFYTALVATITTTFTAIKHKITRKTKKPE